MLIKNCCKCPSPLKLVKNHSNSGRSLECMQNAWLMRRYTNIQRVFCRRTTNIFIFLRLACAQKKRSSLSLRSRHFLSTWITLQFWGPLCQSYIIHIMTCRPSKYSSTGLGNQSSGWRCISSYSSPQTILTYGDCYWGLDPISKFSYFSYSVPFL